MIWIFVGTRRWIKTQGIFGLSIPRKCDRRALRPEPHSDTKNRLIPADVAVPETPKNSAPTSPLAGVDLLPKLQAAVLSAVAKKIVLETH